MLTLLGFIAYYLLTLSILAGLFIALVAGLWLLYATFGFIAYGISAIIILIIRWRHDKEEW
jgi:uncharacterized membrane protein YcfT